MSRSPEDLVRAFLRAQNLEQIERIEEAIALYEKAVEGGFDSAGPYDRLIHIYRGREAHADVIRVAEAALQSVRTFDDKRSWYARIIEVSQDALRVQPDQRGAEF